MPRFQGDNLVRNLELVDTLKQLGTRMNATPAQLAIAWVTSRDEDIVPLIGARRRAQLYEALQALNLQLDEAALTQIEAAVPAERVAGTRYAAAQLVHLDSER